MSNSPPVAAALILPSAVPAGGAGTSDDGSAAGVGLPWRTGTLSYSHRGLIALMGLLLWGDFAWSMRERSVGTTFQIIVHAHGGSDFLVGLLMGTVPSLIGMVLGPVVSYHSDRLRGARGRRIPFLLASTPFIVLSLVGLAVAPLLAPHVLPLLTPWFSALDLNTVTLLLLAGSWVVYDISAAVANAVFGGLINDVVPREVIGRFFSLFRALSLIAGMIFNYWFVGQAQDYATMIFLFAGGLYGVGFTFMCLRVREGGYPPPPPAAGGPLAALRGYARRCFSQPYYLLLYVVLSLSGLAFLAVNAFGIFAANSVGLSNDDFGHYVAASYACSLVLAFPIGWLCDRCHPVRVGLVAICLYALVTACGFCGISGPRSFGAVFVAHVILSGTFFTATAGLGQMLYPRASFGQFAAAAGICSSVVHMVFPPALGAFLDHTGHEYQLTFALAAVLAGSAIIGWLAFYRQFRRHGGPAAYRAPGDEEIPVPAGVP